MIADLRQENKNLHLQFKAVEDLNKDITSSRDSHQERHNVMKVQAKNLKSKFTVPFAKSKVDATAAHPSS